MVFFKSSTSSTYITLQPLGVFDCMVGKLSVSAFQNFFQIENPLNINEVMSKNVYVWFFLNLRHLRHT